MIRSFRKASLETKVFNMALWCIIVMFIYGIGYRVWLKEYWAALVDLAGLLIATGMFYYSWKKNISNRLSFPLILAMMGFNIYFWFQQDGLSDNSILYFSSLIVAIIIVTDRWLNFIAFFFLFVELILIILDKYFHHLPIWGASPSIPHDFSILTVIVVFLIWYLKRNYSHKQKKIINFSNSLKELNQFNLTKVNDFDSAINEYLKTGEKILKLQCGMIIHFSADDYLLDNIDSSMFPQKKIEEIISANHAFLDKIRANQETTYSYLRSQDSNGKGIVFIGTPIMINDALNSLLVFFSEVNSRRLLEDLEIEILELMALNISHLFSLQLWKENQKSAEIALKQSEYKFKGIFDSANTGISVSDRNGKMLISNPALQRLLGCEENDLTGKYFYAYSHPDDLEEDVRLYEELIMGKITNYQLEKRLINTKGDIIHINMTVSITKNDLDGDQFVITIFENITSRKHSENEIIFLNKKLEDQVDKLELANKELESFSYSVSHDLRAPLRAIDGFSKIVIEEYADKLDDEGKRLLNVITTNSKKMSTLIDDLLTFSRISRKTTEFKKISLQSIVKELINELGFDQDIFDMGSLPEIKGEPTLMKQVYSNLMNNAVKFSSKEEHPKISIGSIDKKEHYELFVKDNGVGFDMRYYDKLFGVFQRLHTDEEFKGTGVGLAIVEKVISKHKGKVWAESELGKGTTFWFTIPKVEL